MTDGTGPGALRMAGTIAALTADSSYVRRARGAGHAMALDL